MRSIFFNYEIYISGFNKFHGLTISKKFVECADKQLTAIFERDSGLTINKLISIGWRWNSTFFYTKGEQSKFASEVWVNNNNNPIIIAWKSKSGRIYDIADTDIDCDDIEFWFEGFDAVLYHKQMYPNFKLPFKLKDLSYELVVTRLNMDATIEMTLKPGSLPDEAAITEQVDQFIDDYNTNSEKKDRKYGVIHNWKSKLEDNLLVYEIDTGFTGAYFLKNILLFLSDINVFEKVEVK